MASDEAQLRAIDEEFRKATTDDEMFYLEKLKAMGVDLTQYLVAQRQKPADTEVRITSDEKAPVLHMHVDDRSKK